MVTLASLQKSNSLQQLQIRKWSPLPRLSLFNVTLTCDPSAPPEPTEALEARVYNGHDYRHAWRVISDLRLPAKVLLAHRHIRLEGVPLLGEPAARLQRDTWLEPAPELLEAPGGNPLVDFAYSYEPVLIGLNATVRAT